MRVSVSSTIGLSVSGTIGVVALDLLGVVALDTIGDAALERLVTLGGSMSIQLLVGSRLKYLFEYYNGKLW